MSNLLSQASLVMIPSGYKEDVVYSPIPTNGNGDLSFTRASNGTRVNSAGLVEVVSWNMAGYSEDFSNAYWTKNNIPVMAYNVATAPNGTMTADSIKSDSSSVYQSVSATTITVAPNSTVTLSIYIKKETSKTYFTGSYLYFTGGTTKLTYVLFDEVNGSINIIAPDEVSMVTSVESVGNWWRFIVTGTDTGNNTNLDFAFYGTLSQNGTSLNPGIGSVRTIWGAQVNIGSTAKPYFPTTDRLNVPRLTYQNGGGGCPSLLLEKQSTNTITYSEDITNSLTTLVNTTITANYGTSPDGTQNADLVAFTGASAYALRNQTVAASTTYTMSLFVKNNNFASSEILSFNMSDGIIGGLRAEINVVAKTATYSGAGGAWTSVSGKVEDYGNGWFRVSITGTSVSGGGGWYEVTTSGITRSCYLWGLSLEISSYPTSYIPTTSASATRVVDVCSKTGISSLIGSTTGSVFVDFELYTLDGFEGVIEIINTSNANQRFLIWRYNNGLDLYFQPYGTYFSSAISIGRHKVCFTYTPTLVKYFVDGVKIGQNTSTGSITGGFDKLDFENSAGGVNIQKKNIYESVVSKTEFTDAEAISLTTI